MTQSFVTISNTTCTLYSQSTVHYITSRVQLNWYLFYSEILINFFWITMHKRPFIVKLKKCMFYVWATTNIYRVKFTEMRCSRIRSSINFFFYHHEWMTWTNKYAKYIVGSLGNTGQCKKVFLCKLSLRLFVVSWINIECNRKTIYNPSWFQYWFDSDTIFLVNV